MSKVIGIIKEIIGTVKLTTQDGAVKILSKGDAVHEGETIDAMSSSQAIILLNNGKEIIIDGDTTIALTEDYINSYTPEITTADTEADIAEVEALLANDEEGPAAGEDGGNNNGGLSNAYYHDRLNFDENTYELDRINFEQDDIFVEENDGDTETIVPLATDEEAEPTPEPEVPSDNAPVFDTPNDDPDGDGTDSAYAFTYNENSEDTTLIGTVHAVDADGDDVTYSITTNENGYYEIDANTGEISLTPAGVTAYANDYELGDNAQVITVTASDGTNTTPITVNLNETAQNDNPVAVDVTVNVSEEGLEYGIEDTEGTNDDADDTTNNVIAEGQIITDADGDSLTITLAEPNQPLSSNGEVVEWSGVGTDTLIGHLENGTEIISINVDDTGKYTVTLLGPVDHESTSVEDTLSLDISVTANDGTSDVNSTLTVVIEDDMPTANDIVQEVTIPLQNSNVMIMLDLSGSMDDNSGVFDENGNELTYLEVAKSAITDMLNDYELMGDVRVQVGTFASELTVENETWLTVSEAIDYISDLTADGGTNYDYALDGLETMFDTDGKIDDAQNISYFFSDGQPTFSDDNPDSGWVYNDGNSIYQYGNSTQEELGDGIDATETLAWQEFLSENEIVSNSIGLGTGVAQTYLDPIAYNGVTNTDTDAIIVSDLNTLSDNLNATVPEEISGDIMTGNMVDSGFGIGADHGYIEEISIDNGDTYSFDGTTITANNTNSTYEFDGDTNTLTVVTSSNSTLIVDLDNGGYRMAANSTLTESYTESVGFSLVDNDGDSASGTITFNINREANDSVLADELTLSMSVGDAVTEDIITDTDNFTDGSSDDWSGDNISFNNDYMYIEGGYNTASKTFDYGEAHAGETVTITFTTDIRSEKWDGRSDYFRVYNNGTEIFENGKTSALTNEEDLDSSILHTFTTTLDDSGQAIIKFYTDSDKSNEYVRVDDFSIVGSESTYSYSLNLDADPTKSTDALSNITLTNVPDGVTLQDSDGNVITQNIDNSYTVTVASDGTADLNIISKDDALDTSSITASVSSTDTEGNVVTTTIGGSGDDEIVFEEGDIVDGGIGEDTLLINDEITLDFDNVSSNIDNIEKIELGTGAQDITLDMGDILDMNDSGKTLEISGDSSDHVTLDGTGDSNGAWELISTENGFSQYQATDGTNTATILIEQEIQVEQS